MGDSLYVYLVGYGGSEGVVIVVVFVSEVMFVEEGES